MAASTPSSSLTCFRSKASFRRQRQRPRSPPAPTSLCRLPYSTATPVIYEEDDEDMRVSSDEEDYIQHHEDSFASLSSVQTPTLLTSSSMADASSSSPTSVMMHERSLQSWKRRRQAQFARHHFDRMQMDRPPVQPLIAPCRRPTSGA